MAYHKHSIVGGRDAAGQYDNTSRRGHITVETARKIVARNGWTQGVLTHHVGDMSGHGRGGRREIDLVTGLPKAAWEDVDDSEDFE